MESDPHVTTRSDPGLPPVAPPSGQMILRLFLVPGLIVAGLVLLFLAGPMLYGWVGKMFGRPGGGTPPSQLLRNLDSTNPDVRWRAASDLAQVLLRDDQLAADPEFALQLADRLRQALDESAAAEREAATRAAGWSAEEAARQRKKLDPQRNYTQYLGACLGNVLVPVGVPLLTEMATQETGMQEHALTARRRKAVWALANLGNTLGGERFNRLTEEQKDAAEKQLEQASAEGRHDKAAKAALDYLRQRRQGRATALGVDRAMEKCADADDPFLRELAAFTLAFWPGSAEEDARAERILVRLAHDNGRGEDVLARHADEDPGESRPFTRKPGFKVCANATVALARRSSPRVRLDMLQEMLDPEALRDNFRVRRKDGTEQADENLVILTVLETLKAVHRLHAGRPELDLSRLRQPVERLAQDANPAIQTQARQALPDLEPAR